MVAESVYPLQFPTAIRMAITSSLNTRFVACYIWADKKELMSSHNFQSKIFFAAKFIEDAWEDDTIFKV